MVEATLYTARGCHLCDRARATVEAVRSEIPFALREVDITGDPELEAAYREQLPVLELDGRRAFSFFVSPTRLRPAVEAAAAGAQDGPPGGRL